MAKNYKSSAEKMQPREGETPEEREHRIKNETRLRLEVPEPPLRNVRTAALSAVRECCISIKTDRYQAGRLFQDFAYRVIFPDGDSPARLARRKPFQIWQVILPSKRAKTLTILLALLYAK